MQIKITRQCAIIVYNALALHLAKNTRNIIDCNPNKALKKYCCNFGLVVQYNFFIAVVT